MTNQALGGSRRLSWRTLLDIVATLGSVTAAGALLWMIFLRPPPSQQAGRSAPPVPTEPVSFQGTPTLGSPTAPVVMLEFSDFECPFCAKFATEVFPQIKAKYVDTGQVQVAFRHLPLPIHKRAQRAAEGAVCAALQDKFWPLHDQLFATPGELEEKDLVEYSRRVQINQTEFGKCMDGAAVTQVKVDVDMARTLKLTGTPAFLVGRRHGDGLMRVASVVLGARPLTEFEQAIQDALKQKLVAAIEPQ